MEDVLKTSGIIDSLNNDAHNGGLAKSLKELAGKLTGQNTDVTIQKADYEAVKTAATAIKDSIDKTLESDGLTQLDTANLKAIRSSVVDLEKSFESIAEIKAEGGNFKVLKDDIDKVKAAIEKVSKASKEEVGASATKALASSKAQAENIGES